MPIPLSSAGGERKKKARANCWKTLITTIGVVSEETIPDVEAAEQEDPTLSKVELLCLGKLRGTKFTHESDSFRGPWKSVRYLLATPEGHVFISMYSTEAGANGAKWDESELESYLHTLRITPVRR